MKNSPAQESIALRAFNLLELVVKASAPVSLDDVTRGSGLPKPTVFRILEMLEEADLLQRELVSKRFTVGPRLRSFALDVLQHSVLRAQCHEILQGLVDEIGETCNLTMLEGNEVLYLDRVETTLPLRLSLNPGTRVPLHCTASGKLFLSQMPPKQVHRLLGPGPLKRYTDKTITDMNVLEEELKKTRSTMVGIYDSEYFSDSVAIAVPIEDPSGRMRAAVAVHAPSSRMTIESCMEYQPTLQRAARAIAAVLIPPSEDAGE